MSEESVKIEDINRRLLRLEADVDPIPKILAKQHAVSNMLQVHTHHFDAILGPKDSLLTQVSDLRGKFNLMRRDIDSINKSVTKINETISSIQSDVAQLLESHELQKANVVGLWQMRATMATAVIAAISAMAVAALQFGS